MEKLGNDLKVYIELQTEICRSFAFPFEPNKIGLVLILLSPIVPHMLLCHSLTRPFQNVDHEVRVQTLKQLAEYLIDPPDTLKDFVIKGDCVEIFLVIHGNTCHKDGERINLYHNDFKLLSSCWILTSWSSNCSNSFPARIRKSNYIRLGALQVSNYCEIKNN